jgi:hypothetical protein
MRRIGVSLVLIAALAPAGCGSGERANAPTASSQGGTAATSTLSSVARVERLDCTDGGTLPSTAPALRPGWRRHSIVAGPLTFFYARDLARQPAASFRSERAILRGDLHRTRDPRVQRRIERTLRRMPRGGLGLAELLVLVEPGHSATTVVPPIAQGRLALVYSRRARDAEHSGAAGIIRLADDRAVQFPSCPGDERWQYSGGIIANRAGCVPADVRVGAGRWLRRYLPLGTRQHCGS